MKIWYIRKCQDATKTVLEFIDLNTYMRKEEPEFQLEFKKKWAELQECWKIEYKKGKSQWQEKSNWKNKSKSSLAILIKLTTLLNWEERQEGEERVYVWEEEGQKCKLPVTNNWKKSIYWGHLMDFLDKKIHWENNFLNLT